MVHYAQFKNLVIQASCFTPDPDQFSPASALGSLLNAHQDTFNGNLQVPPLPPGAPPEFPRIAIESKDERFKFQASQLRSDAIWSYVDSDDPEDEQYRCVRILQDYINGFTPALKVGRLALLITRYVDVPDATNTLIKQYCNDASIMGALRNTLNFEIHNHIKVSMDELSLDTNCWTRCKSQELVKPIQKRVVLVEQDINTLHEEVHIRYFKTEQILKFFSWARGRAQVILESHFPESV